MQDFVSWSRLVIPNIRTTLETQIISMEKKENLFAQVTVLFAGDHRFGTGSMQVFEK